MVAALSSRLGQWRLIPQRRMSTRLVFGFCGSILVAMLVLFLIISLLMRARIYRTADEQTKWHAQALQAIVRNEQDFLSQEAVNAAQLGGVDDALAANDLPALKRMLSLSLTSHNLNSAYLLDANRKVLVHVGDDMTDESSLVRLPMVEHALTQPSESAFLDLNSSIWLGAAGAHRSPDGKTTAVVVLGKRLDQEYLQSLKDVMGTEVVLVWGNAAAYSFDTPPTELSLSHVEASLGPLAEYHDVGSFHSMAISKEGFRVAAFSLPERPSGQLTLLLLQPTDVMDESVQQALLGVAGISLLLMLVGSPLLYLYARRVMRPLDRLAEEAKRIAAGDLNRRVEVGRRDEVGQLAQAFEEMRVQVQAMLDAQRQWNAELEGKVQAKTGELNQLLDVRDQLLHETLSVQEGERRRVARELHDETCQSLTALLTNIATAQLMAPDQAFARLPELKATVVETLKEVNRIVFALRPALLDDYGLIPALSWYAEQRLGPDTQTDITTTGPEMRLPPELETILFRVGQEAISNVAKYARARHVKINLTYANGPSTALRSAREGPGNVRLDIQDDGIGFDRERVESRTPHGRVHLGLIGMEERLGQVGGKLEIETTPGRGTHVHATAPLEFRSSEES